MHQIKELETDLRTSDEWYWMDEWMRLNETESIPDERTNQQTNDRMICHNITLNLEMFHDLYSYLVDSIEVFFPCWAWNKTLIVVTPLQGVESI